MNSRRAEIRNAIKTTLTGQTAAGANVFDARVKPLQAKDLVAILIYTPTEAIREPDNNNSPRKQIRELTIHVEGHVYGEGENPAVAAAADALSNAVEQLLFTEKSLGLTPELDDLWLQSIETIVNAEAERDYCGFRMVLSAQYETDEFAAPSDLDDFALFDAKYNLSAAQPPADQAEDLQEMETE